MKGVCDKCGQLGQLINTSNGATGKNICSTCYRDDPTHHEECVRCHEKRPAAERLPDGRARCASCYNHCRRQLKYKRLGYANCSWCGRYRKTRGPMNLRLCKSCRKKQRGCRECGEPGSIHARGRCHACYERKLRQKKKAGQTADP